MGCGLNPQIRLFDVFVGQQAICGIGQGNPAVFHDVSTVGNFQGKIGVLLHEENGGIVFSVYFFYDFKYLLNN